MCCGINETDLASMRRVPSRINLLDQVYFLGCQDVLWYK